MKELLLILLTLNLRLNLELALLKFTERVEFSLIYNGLLELIFHLCRKYFRINRWNKEIIYFRYREIPEDLYCVGSMTIRNDGLLEGLSVGVLNAPTLIYREFMLMFQNIFHGLKNNWSYIRKKIIRLIGINENETTTIKLKRMIGTNYTSKMVFYDFYNSTIFSLIGKTWSVFIDILWFPYWYLYIHTNIDDRYIRLIDVLK